MKVKKGEKPEILLDKTIDFITLKTLQAQDEEDYIDNIINSIKVESKEKNQPCYF